MSQDPIKKLVVKTIPGRPDHRISRPRRFRGRHIFIILVAAGLAFGVYQKWYRVRVGTAERSLVTAPAAQLEPQIMAPPSAVPAAQQEGSEKFEIRHYSVLAGDSIGQILEKFDISKDYIGVWEEACKSAPFENMREGDELIFFLGRNDRQPLTVIYSPSGEAAHTLRKGSADWECRFPDPSPKGAARTVKGRYAENFYDSCIASGLPSTLIPSLADIFAYDVDFNSDFKDGDTFSVYFLEQEIEGTEGRQYMILAAEMTVSQKVFQAFGFQVPEGGWEYFDANGASLKRAFLKSPISYRRLLSASTYKNVKPVLKMYRPHPGIDYAAPRGTPVSAIGDGVVVSLNKRGKSAISIEVRHRGGFRSFYGNLSGYSRDLYRGGIVSQGEVIGSVGSGGHGRQYLDFHFHKGKKAVNFHSIDFARARTVPKTSRAEFEKTRDSYSAALQSNIAQKQEIASGRE
jgi:murein DD-endopeptidase MepM/ murein hydrolase activator NlpD